MNRLLTLSCASKLSSSQSTWGTKYRMPTFGKVEHHVFSSFVPNLRLVYQSDFRTVSSLIQVRKKDQRPSKNLRAEFATVTEFILHFSMFPRSPHTMSLYIDMKMILALNCSGSHWNAVSISRISSRIPTVVNPGKIFHSNSIGSPSIRSKIFEITCFQKPFDVVFAGFDWLVTEASQTEHRVGEDIGFGFRNLQSFVTY